MKFPIFAANTSIKLADPDQVKLHKLMKAVNIIKENCCDFFYQEKSSALRKALFSQGETKLLIVHKI